MITLKESQIESNLIEFLTKHKGYQLADIHNTHELEANMLVQLSKLNGKELNELDLRDIKHYIFDNANGQEAFKYNSILTSSVPLRNRRGDRTETVRLFSRSAGDNVYQVIHQFNDNGLSLSRYDVTLLINGIPFVQIELKRQDIEIDAAINQLNRYINDAFTNWYRLLQLVIVSNETNTRYSVNNNTKLNKQFMFRWSDSENNIIDNLYKFADTFLDCNMLHEIVSTYILRRNSFGSKSLIVMRPYQIYAIKAVLAKIRKPYNTTNRLENNGYVFHTTGSGKTLTSFKCVQMAAELDTVDKVIFLVDRRDLDTQTTVEFKSIESQFDIDETPNTKTLLRYFKNKGNKVIVTTIQKLNIAVQKANNGESDYADYLGAYRDKNIVIIIDECHRTQFGDMHTSIDRFFTHSRYIGFTGTPIFDENATEVGKTTASLFNKELHSYRIDCAIKDRNVLGFAVDYHNTIKVNDKFYSLDSQALAEASSVNSKEIIENPLRIQGIVSKIFEVHKKKTFNKRYTPLFAVESISALLKFYEEFKRQNSTKSDQDKLRVSAIFTATDAAADEKESYKDKLKGVMDDFNSEFSINCEDEESFRAELVKSLKCLREPHLDIVIVVNIFLTGFDSKMTNTLYVDKNLVYHGLLQAFSRTNRVESERKSFGNIVCFRPIKENVDKAIALFNQSNQNATLITKSYENCIKNLLKIIDEVKALVPSNKSMVDASPSEQVEFVIKVRRLNRALNETKQFDEFSWGAISDKLTEDEYNSIIGQFKTLSNDVSKQDNDKESILSYIDFCMELVETDKIDLDYIRQLISNIDTSTVESTEVYAKNIKDVLDKSTNDALIYKKDIIKRFLDKLIMDRKSGAVASNVNIEAEFRKFVQGERLREIKEQSLESGIDKDYIENVLVINEAIGKINKAQVEDKITERNKYQGFKQRKSLKEKFFKWVEVATHKFSGLF